jgi:hypothetical protein
MPIRGFGAITAVYRPKSVGQGVAGWVDTKSINRRDQLRLFLSERRIVIVRLGKLLNSGSFDAKHLNFFKYKQTTSESVVGFFRNIEGGWEGRWI